VNNTHRIARIAIAVATALAGAALAQSVAITPKYPGKVHLLPATLETTQWGWFDNAQPPVLKIDSGDTVTISSPKGARAFPFSSVAAAKLLLTDKLINATAPLSTEGADQIEETES